MVTDTRAPVLDLSAAVGQLNYTFRFALSDSLSGRHLGDLTPIRSPATLDHDTSMTVKRRLTLELGTADTAAIDARTDRIDLFMIIPGIANPDRSDGQWPLGRYAWSDNPRRVTTAGRLASPTLNDEMFVLDQEIETGINGRGIGVQTTILQVVAGQDVTLDMQPTIFTSAEAWGIGSQRARILEALAVSGDYFSPWFNNLGALRFLRTFDPAKQVPDINFDDGYRVLRADIGENDELLTAPNRFIVISNGAGDPSSPVVGVADVPINAPNSIPNLGFARPKTFQLQIDDGAQAAAVAQGLMQRSTILETVTLSTPADPRHDGYNVVRWQGANWLELSWSMTLAPGAPMTHMMRKSYGAT